MADKKKENEEKKEESIAIEESGSKEVKKTKSSKKAKKFFFDSIEGNIFSRNIKKVTDNSDFENCEFVLVLRPYSDPIALKAMELYAIQLGNTERSVQFKKKLAEIYSDKNKKLSKVGAENHSRMFNSGKSKGDNW